MLQLAHRSDKRIGPSGRGLIVASANVATLHHNTVPILVIVISYRLIITINHRVIIIISFMVVIIRHKAQDLVFLVFRGTVVSLKSPGHLQLKTNPLTLPHGRTWLNYFVFPNHQLSRCKDYNNGVSKRALASVQPFRMKEK